MLTSDIAEILIKLGYKLKENPNDLLTKVELKEKLSLILDNIIDNI